MSWDETLKELREQYIRGSSDRLANIDRALDVLEIQPADEIALKDLRRYFHGLGGSGKTYGFAQVTEIGLWGEQECDGILREKFLPTLDHLNRWRGFSEELRKEFQKASIDDSGLSKREEAHKICSTSF